MKKLLLSTLCIVLICGNRLHAQTLVEKKHAPIPTAKPTPAESMFAKPKNTTTGSAILCASAEQTHKANGVTTTMTIPPTDPVTGKSKFSCPGYSATKDSYTTTQLKNLPPPSVDKMVCTSKTETVSLDSDDFMATAVQYGDQEPHIYPGAVYTFDAFMSGAFNPIKAPRNAIKLQTEDASVHSGVSRGRGVSRNYVDVAAPDETSIRDGVYTLQKGVPNDVGELSYQQQLEAVDSMEDIALKMHAGASAYGASASVEFDQSTKEGFHSFMIDAVKENYTITATVPDNGIFVDPAASAALKAPMMMKSVVYGHRILAQIQTTLNESDLKLALEGKYEGGVASANAGVSYEKIKRDERTKFRLYIVGGPTNDQWITANAADLQAKLNQHMAASDSKNAKPIRYTFVNLDNETIQASSATDAFTARNCIPDEPNSDWDVTVTLDQIQVTGSGADDTRVGVRQDLRLFLNGDPNPVASAKGDQNSPFICWWQGQNECTDPVMATNGGLIHHPDPLASRVYHLKESDVLQDGNCLQLETGYIADYRTHAGGSTNGKIIKQVAAFCLSELDKTSKGSQKTVVVPLDNKNFEFLYGIKLEKHFD